MFLGGRSRVEPLLGWFWLSFRRASYGSHNRNCSFCFCSKSQQWSSAIGEEKASRGTGGTSLCSRLCHFHHSSTAEPRRSNWARLVWHFRWLTFWWGEGNTSRKSHDWCRGILLEARSLYRWTDRERVRFLWTLPARYTLGKWLWPCLLVTITLYYTYLLEGEDGV